ncbi:stage V sporulation protein T [Treponema sp. R6D11]
MKATGVVRRIDDLGRVVIPKEIRRTMRIREGDPLEIFTNHDGEVIFKKYSPIGELTEFATQYAESLSKTANRPTVITDKDSIIAVSGASKRELSDKKVSRELEEIMRSKQAILVEPTADDTVPIVEDNEKYKASVICPILSEGDSIGTVVFLDSEENAGKPGEVESMLAQSAAGFLGKQMED